MGGALTLGALAASDDIVAGAPFYGVNFGLFDAKKLNKPVQGHFGALDAMEGFSDPATGKRLEKELTNAKVFIYEGVGHAFMNPTRRPPTFEERQEKMGFPAYDMRQADLAWGRLLDFFLEHLGRAAGRTDLPIHTPATDSQYKAACFDSRVEGVAYTGNNSRQQHKSARRRRHQARRARSSPARRATGIQGAS